MNKDQKEQGTTRVISLQREPGGSSDRTLKRDINRLNNGITRLMALQPSAHIDIKTESTRTLMSYLVSAVQEQQWQITQLQLSVDENITKKS